MARAPSVTGADEFPHGHRSGNSLRWLTLAAALWVLNFALTFHNVWPTLWIETRHELSIELAVLLSVLAVFAERNALPSRRAVAALAGALLVMTVGRYADVTVPAVYGRPVNLYWDAEHVPKVAAMLAKVADPWLLGVGFVAALGLLCVLFAVLRAALARVVRGLAAPAERRLVGALSLSLVLLFALGRAGPPALLDRFATPVTAAFERQIDHFVDALTEARSGNLLPPPADLGEFDLARLSGPGRKADVLVAFLESYGAVSFDDERMAAAMVASRDRFAAAVEASGLEAVSAFVESPTFGGASWLAHASFMTGLRVDHSGAYELLVTEPRDSLPRWFRRRGYRAVAMMPGLREAWPEGAFYGFDEIYGAAALAYRGPEFGWWRIPDQYALARLDELELGVASRPPLFVFFPTISTHVPFRPTPPYQPDWSRLTGPDPYDAAPLEASLAERPAWLDLAPAYAASLEYAYDYWAGYLKKPRSSPFLLVMLGDHQPAASVSGTGARWDVPVHVIAADSAILRELEAAGFSAGLIPRAAPVAPMHELAPLLLRAFSRDTANAGIRGAGTGRGDGARPRGTRD